MKRILICGPRDWLNPEPLGGLVDRLVLKFGARNFLVIEGKAPGVDTLVGSAAKDRGVHVAEVGALWDHYKRAAGPMRNGVMLALQPHHVIALHWNLDDSKGTARCVEQARAASIHTKVIIVPEHIAKDG